MQVLGVTERLHSHLQVLVIFSCAENDTYHHHLRDGDVGTKQADNKPGHLFEAVQRGWQGL